MFFINKLKFWAHRKYKFDRLIGCPYNFNISQAFQFVNILFRFL